MNAKRAETARQYIEKGKASRIFLKRKGTAIYRRSGGDDNAGGRRVGEGVVALLLLVAEAAASEQAGQAKQAAENDAQEVVLLAFDVNARCPGTRGRERGKKEETHTGSE